MGNLNYTWIPGTRNWKLPLRLGDGWFHLAWRCFCFRRWNYDM